MRGCLTLLLMCYVPLGSCLPQAGFISLAILWGKRQPLSASSSSCGYHPRDPGLPNVELPPASGVFPGDLIKPLFTLGLTAQGSSCPSDRPNTGQFEQQHG